jgi:hypothetical protein
MDLTKLSVTDLFLYQEMLEQLLDDVDNETTEEILGAKLDKIQQELLNRIDTI